MVEGDNDDGLLCPYEDFFCLSLFVIHLFIWKIAIPGHALRKAGGFEELSRERWRQKLGGPRGLGLSAPEDGLQSSPVIPVTDPSPAVMWMPLSEG